MDKRHRPNIDFAVHRSWCTSVLIRGAIQISVITCPIKAAYGICVCVACPFILSVFPVHGCPCQAMPPFMPLLVLKDLQRNGHTCFTLPEILEFMGFCIGCDEVDKRRAEVSCGRFLAALLKRAFDCNSNLTFRFHKPSSVDCSVADPCVPPSNRLCNR